MCGLQHGLKEDHPGALPQAKRYTDKLEGRVAENVKVLQMLLEETPEPSITKEEYKRRRIPRTERGILCADLLYYIEDFDYVVEVEGQGEVESDSLEEEDEHDNDHELPPLKGSSRTPERKENTP
ncbi:hypothetical protein LB503_005055 [Fusarium chuoi]|nr:hypothetical protein LB503_005055 [Fusarium chuoi]